MNRAPLNIFQKTQRLWDTIHPYNAAQLATLSGAQPAVVIEEAFNRAIRGLRLGIFDCRKGRYHVEPAPRVPLSITDEPLKPLLTRMMNARFDAQRSFPFRPFIHQSGETQTIGLVYQHWVADSVSIRLLMQAWIRSMHDPACAIQPVRLPRGGMWHYFAAPSVGWSVVGQLSSLAGFASRMKQMRRIERRAESQDVAVVVRELPADLILRIRRGARARGATVGDVFIAAAADTLAMYGANAATSRRPGLAMGTIVDTRARARSVSSRIFGLFLGFTMTPFNGRDAQRFDRLLARAVKQRKSDLRRHAAEASQLNMAIGYFLARRMRPQNLLEFYRKRFPLAGGLSSVNLGSEWSQDLHPAPVALYHRVSPTGPLMPIVFTPTTLGNRLSLCCTYRTALLTPDQIERVIAQFTERLIQFAGKTDG
ncbi:MAG: hypothetical protein ACTHLN_01250 [Tepidisphaeraceae bacterium]